MKKTSIMFDPKTRKLLDDYCLKTGKKFSQAIREFIHDGVGRYQQFKEIGFKESVGSKGLMKNEKRAIRSSIESTLILRSLIKEPKVLDAIMEKTDEILREGWIYDNK